MIARLLRHLGLAPEAERPVELASSEAPSIALAGDFGSAPARRLRKALARARSDRSSLPDWLLAMEGMSGRRYRRLVNHLVGATPDAAYMEIGSWTGSTACAAMHGNTARILCIDNWSAFGGPKEAFLANVARCASNRTAFYMIENDCHAVNYATLGPYNIFFYDGPHSAEDTHRSITLAQPALAPVHTLIVDDWNWDRVREGTRRALAELGTTVIAEIAIRTTPDGSHPEVAFQASDWHNGYFLAVCRK